MSLWLFWRVIFHWEILGEWLKSWHSGRTKTPARTDHLPELGITLKLPRGSILLCRATSWGVSRWGWCGYQTDLSLVPRKKQQGGEIAQWVLLTQSPHSCDLSLLLLWGRDAAAGTREVLQGINCSPDQAPLCWQLSACSSCRAAQQQLVTPRASCMAHPGSGNWRGTWQRQPGSQEALMNGLSTKVSRGAPLNTCSDGFARGQTGFSKVRFWAPGMSEKSKNHQVRLELNSVPNQRITIVIIFLCHTSVRWFVRRI